MVLGNMLCVAVGAGFGVLARVMTVNWINGKMKGAFPLGTFTVNMFGTLILGMVTGFGLNATYSLLIGTGFLGSFTTFSTFQVENVELLKAKRLWVFLFYFGCSCILGIVLLFAGVSIGKACLNTFNMPVI